MTLRLINAVTHDLSGGQVLEVMLRLFQESTHEPITLLAKRGDGENLIQKVRTALSKNRRKMKRTETPIHYFGFSTEGPFRFKLGGIDYDSYAVQFHVTGLQRMRNLSSSKSKEFAL